MSLISEIEDSFYKALTEYIDTPIIFSYGAGVEPTGDYGVIDVVNLQEERVAETHQKLTDEALLEVTQEQYLGTVNIRFYGDSSYENAMKAHGLMNSRWVAQGMFTNDSIGLQVVGTLRRSDEIRDTTVVRKAIFPVNFFIAYEHEIVIDWFDTVGYEGEVTGASADSQYISDTVSASDT